MVLTGRGGYGNHTTTTKARAPSSSPPPVKKFTSPQQTVKTGRGGYGNHLPVDKAVFPSPQQYLNEVDLREHLPERYYTGRGGRGNFVEQKSKFAKAKQSIDSEESSLSAMFSAPHPAMKDASLWSKLKTTLSH